jgi:L-threonylcarbamoyladenylate synthase
MKTLVIKDNKNITAAAADCAAALRTPGSVVLIPTETVYGLACAHGDAAAENRIYEMKQRLAEKALAIFVRRAEDLRGIGAPPPPEALKIAGKLCPGRLTIVFTGQDGVKTGFRIPDHPFALALLEAFGKPLSCTSANLSGQPAALSVAEALSSLASMPDIAVDGGPLPSGSLASTVAELLPGGGFKILRQGAVTEAVIAAAAALSDMPAFKNNGSRV